MTASYQAILARQKRAAKVRALVERGAVPMKQWRTQEAQRLGVSEKWAHALLYRGKYPDLSVIRLNQRVVLVVKARSMTPEPSELGVLRQKVRRVALGWLRNYGRKSTPLNESILARKLAWQILDVLDSSVQTATPIDATTPPTIYTRAKAKP